MASIAEMAEAHLLNVEREIKALNERKASIDVEIERLQSYLQEGVETLKSQTATSSDSDNEPEDKAKSTISNQVF